MASAKWANCYYTPNEVAVHNVYNDAWVSVFGKVLNITPLIAEYVGTPGSLPLLRKL